MVRSTWVRRCGGASTCVATWPPSSSQRTALGDVGAGGPIGEVGLARVGSASRNCRFTSRSGTWPCEARLDCREVERQGVRVAGIVRGAAAEEALLFHVGFDERDLLLGAAGEGPVPQGLL